MNNNTFPIKYAVQPIYTYAKTDVIPLGFIVTKVFIVSETNNYKPDGTKTNNYQVVYPIKGLKTSEYLVGIRYPEFNHQNICINSEHSKDVFDTYEEAKKLCDEKNGYLFTNYYQNENLLDRMQYFQDFEYKVMEKTSDMEIDNKIERR